MHILSDDSVRASQLRLLSCLQAQATSDVTVIISDGDVAANGATDGSRTVTASDTVIHAAQYPLQAS